LGAALLTLLQPVLVRRCPQLLLLSPQARVLVLLLGLPDATVWSVLSWVLPLLLLLSALCCASCA
jgi:hypothetical protein